MGAARHIVALGTQASPMREVSGWLRRLGYRVLATKSPEEARRAVRLAGPRVGALLIARDLPALDLRTALRSIRGNVDLSVVVVGRPPRIDAGEERARLRTAGVAYALWAPLDEATLRFQINRALADGQSQEKTRGALRAPVNWRVDLLQGRRKKKAQLYTLSPGGAFLQLANPSPRNSELIVSLRLAGGDARLRARVALTNVPGTFLRTNLPVGMGVVFEGNPAETEAELLMLAMERLRELDV